MRLIKFWVLLILCMVTTACSSKSENYAVACVRVEKLTADILVEMAEILSTENDLKLRNLESDLTSRQQSAGHQLLLAEDKQIHVVFRTGEHQVSDICAYDDSGKNNDRAMKIITRTKERLSELGIKYTTPVTAPPSELRD